MSVHHKVVKYLALGTALYLASTIIVVIINMYFVIYVTPFVISERQGLSGGATLIIGGDDIFFKEHSARTPNLHS